jgi:hypothetical protein
MKIFISHSSYDKWVARQISEELGRRGHKTFLDEKDIKTGDSIDVSIQEHLKDSDDLLVLISPSSLKSHWVFIEIGGAKALGKKIVPILLHIQPNDVPQAISQLLAKDLNDIDRYFAELEHRQSAGKKAGPPAKPKPRKSDITTFRGFSVGELITIVDGSLLTKEDKEESPKWVDGMDKYSGVKTKIAGFTKVGTALLEADEEKHMWHTKWLRKA